MPIQTTQKTNVYFPDGAQVLIKEPADPGFTDLGAISSTITNTLNYTENQVNTSNAGNLVKQIRDMTISGGFTLINLNPLGVKKLGGGIFEQVETAGTPVSTIPVQTIAAGWSANDLNQVIMLTSISDSTELRTSAKPVISAINIDPLGTNEVLTEDEDYQIIANDNFRSGWGIVFLTAGIVLPSPTTFPIDITYGTNTPVGTTALHMGTSTQVLTAYALRIVHTDSASRKRQIDLYSVDTNSGGFQFNFKGANEDGVEEMPLTYTGKLDTELTDGRQLMTWSIEAGAE